MDRMKGLAARMGNIMGGNPQFTAEFSSQPQVQQTAFRPTGFQQQGFSPQGLQQEAFNPQGVQQQGFNPRGMQQQAFNPQGVSQAGFSPRGVASNDFSPRGIQQSPYSPKYRPPGASGSDRDGGIGDELYPGETGKGGKPGKGNGPTGLDGVYAEVDKYSVDIEEAAKAVGDPDFDSDIFRAIIALESQGNPNARHSGGASGLLQLMPGVWRPGAEDPFNPRDNLMAGARLMREKIAAVRNTYKKLGITRTGKEFAIDLAKAWLGGFDYETGGSNGLADSNGTDGDKYATIFAQHYDAIKSQRSKTQSNPARTNSKGLASLWGGGEMAVTQEFGRTEFSAANASIYDYATCFGMAPGQHTGLDVGTKTGQQLYSPVGGTVVVAGCTSAGCYFKDERLGAGEGRGELRIRLDNGHELILGHMSQINVKVGQRIEAGAAVGLGGFANGDHTHVEYRIPASTPCGQKIVDPRDYL